MPLNCLPNTLDPWVGGAGFCVRQTLKLLGHSRPPPTHPQMQDVIRAQSQSAVATRHASAFAQTRSQLARRFNDLMGFLWARPNLDN